MAFSAATISSKRASRALQGILLCALLIPGVAFGKSSRDTVGRVVSAQGAVFAQTPGEERRILQCRDPIFSGDRVITLDGSAVGIDSGAYHARLGENSEVEMGASGSSSPRVDLVKGHVRLIDSAGSSAESAELMTPGLRVARTGPDQDALVLREKVGDVSMVCAYDAPVNVARRHDPSQSLAASPGSCVVAKPREALYAAQASHPQLAVLMRDACEDFAMVPVADRFSVDDVALGPGLAAGSAILGGAPPPDPSALAPSPTQPCGGGSGCSPVGDGSTRGGGGPGQTTFPFTPVPGLQTP